MATNTSSQNLEKISDGVVETLIPVLVILCLYIVMGILGNPFVLVFYGVRARKTPSFKFIVCLAVFDLIVCCVSVPMEILDVVEFYTFPSAGACKLLRFVNYFATMTSGLFLLAIAADRYRNICRPLQKQLSNKIAKILVVVIIFGGVFLAWPSFVFYTVVPVNVTVANGAVGYDCKTLEDDSYQLLVTVYHGLLVLIFIISTIALTVIYALVVRQLLRTKDRFRSVHEIPKSPKTPQAEGDKSENSDTAFTFSDKRNEELKNGFTEIKDKSVSEHDKSLSTDISSKQNRLADTDKFQTKPKSTESSKTKKVFGNTKSTRSTKKKETFQLHTRKYTFIAIAITVGFVLSFLPYLCIFLWLTITEIDVVSELTKAELVLVELGVRTWIINSVINPFIYGFFNTKFREFVFRSVYGIFCCRVCGSSSYGVNDNTWVSFSASPKSTAHTGH